MKRKYPAHLKFFPVGHEYSFGFTIIELLVVFSIAVILAGGGFVALAAYSRKQALDQTVQDAKAAIEQAKYNAVSKTKPSGCGNNVISGFQYVICSKAACTTPNVTYETVADCGVATPAILTKKIPSSITVQDSTTCTKVIYNTLTGFVGSACRIDFGGYGSTKSIMVDSAGNASVL